MLKRFVSLISVLALGAALAFLMPNFEITAAQIPQARELEVKARDLQLVCPGGVYQSGGSSGTKLGSFVPLGAGTVSSRFANPNPANVTLKREGPVFTVADPEGLAEQGSMLLNANQIQLVGGSAIAGLTGAACQRPTSEQWLIGGDTDTGRESLLILKNPTAVDATVDLEIFGQGGRVSAPGLTGIAVVAGKEVVLPLSSYAPKTKTMVTHVTATGGSIASWIQQKTVRGLAASGVDYVSPSIEGSKRLVIPGVFIRGSKDATALASANNDFADLAPVLRVFVPGDKPATVTAQIMGTSATTFGTVIRQSINAGQVADLAISGLADGDYIAVIDSSASIQASLRLSRTNKTKKPISDFTWLQAVPAFKAAQAISIPPVGISKLSIFNSKTSRVQTIEVGPGSNYFFAKSEVALFANLIVDVDGAVTSIPVLDSKNSGGTVQVRVR